jgi:hypothetical protein
LPLRVKLDSKGFECEVSEKKEVETKHQEWIEYKPEKQELLRQKLLNARGAYFFAKHFSLER